MTMRWNPWRELARRQHIYFALQPLPDRTGGAVYWPKLHRSVILIDPRLTPIERTAALAHELVHDERDGGVCDGYMPAPWNAITLREEAHVNREVARRLVPIDELEDFVAGMVDLGLGVGADEVAEYFDVARWVALVALRLLQDMAQPTSRTAASASEARRRAESTGWA